MKKTSIKIAMAIVAMLLFGTQSVSAFDFDPRKWFGDNNRNSAGITAGMHELEFVVKNDAYEGPDNPTGLLYKVTISYCVSNTPPSTTGTISGMKYNDLNRNGQKDVNEPGLAGWTIRLRSGNKVITTTTDVKGNYSFTDLQPGTYKVREVHQRGWKRMSKNPKKIVIIGGATVTDVDFGNAVKQKKEREDTDKDDNCNDESGYYYAWNHDNHYSQDHDNKEHRSYPRFFRFNNKR
jgi:hypothetical protein